MILVTMGTQPIECKRIIETIINSNIEEKIIVQAFYKPDPSKKYKNIEFYDFISYEDMETYIDEASIIIASGTGAIFRALNKNKKVIIFPRLGKYKEAVDDHGLEMKFLKDDGYCEFVEEEKDFKKTFYNCKNTTFKKFQSNTKKFIINIKEEIKKL